MIRRLSRFLFYLLTATCVLAVLSPLISPRIFWPVAVPGLLYIYLMIFQVFFFVYWVYRKDNMAFVSLLVMVMFSPYLSRTISLYPMGSPGGTEVFRVANYNIYGLKNYRKALENDGDAARVEFRADWEDMPVPDVLCLQEANGYVLNLLEEILHYPNQYRLGSRDHVMLSKHRILDKGEVDLPTRSGKCTWADVQAPGRRLRVYCVHLESNRVSSDADQLLREGNIQEKKSWQKAVQMFRNYMTSARDRAVEVGKIREHIENSPHPVILLGDLNDTPVSFTYQQMSRGLKDAFVKNTRGISSTYGGLIPFLRIDYIFTDKDCHVLDYQVPRWPWSDHYPIFAEIALDSLGNKAN